MNRETLQSLPKYAISFDCETHLKQEGLAAPPLVCGSIAWLDEAGKIQGKLLDKEEALDEFWAILSHPKKVMVGAFICYDLLVCAVEWVRRGRDPFPLIFKALREGRVYDILNGEELGAIADGCLRKDPRTGGDLRDPITNEAKKYYSLEIVTDLRLGRKDAKVNARWRKRYYELDGIPIALWPQDARDYPVDDVRNTLEDCFAQTGHFPSLGRHRWREIPGGDFRCANCGKSQTAIQGTPTAAECWYKRPARNLHSMAVQVETAWAMHLGGAWGFNVDQPAVDVVVKEVEETRKAIAPKLVEWGFLKWKKEKGVLRLSENRGKIAHAVAAAYGAHGKCDVCGGVGRVPKDKIPTRVAYDPEKHGKGCTACCSTGFDLSTVPDLPKTDPSETYPEGTVQQDADTLSEAGDDKLGVLAEYKADAKVISNYGPYLRKAKRGTRNIPLNLWGNVLLETDRTSYADAIQQFPRDGGLRACITARPGYVLCSCDYNQGEVITHAQSCLWILGKSAQADMILTGKEPHSMFGAQVLGVGYDDFFKNKKKNKNYANARQAAKPWIFGRPGRMGVPKLVATQRKSGPDTICPNGPIFVKDEITKQMVRGYRGLRFCILMDGATSCGDYKVTSWGHGEWERKIRPTCKRCLDCAERLKREYSELFPEYSPYCDFTSQVVEEGQPLTDEQCDVHGLPHGSQLNPGEMCQHVSNIIRGGVGVNDCANGYFQSLLAVASKYALREAQRECCDVTAVVPTDACAGGKVSKFAGQPSPLLGSRCIVIQHDEIIAEFPIHKAHECAQRLSEIMVRCLQEVCPDLAAIIKAPPALMFRWLKAAEPWWEQGGEKPANDHDRLTAWYPEEERNARAGNGVIVT